MTVGSILIGLALLLLVGLFISRPLFKPERRRTTKPTTRQALMAQKGAILTEIRALDIDFNSGKLPEVDYQQKREELMAEAKAILKQLDALDEAVPAIESVQEPQIAGLDQDSETAAAASIESAVASLRAKPVQSTQKTAEAKTAGSTNGKTNFCPQCGQPTDAGDKFCASCGHKLLLPQHA